MSGQLHAPASLLPGEGAAGTHWRGGWVDPSAGLDDVAKIKFVTLPGLEIRSFGRPARIQSLYRLRYPGSNSDHRRVVTEALHRLMFLVVFLSSRIQLPTPSRL
jgi:hypothetical protein